MSTEENTFAADTAMDANGSNPPLVELASQLSPSSEQGSEQAPQLRRPQVVFVEQQRQTRIVEVSMEPQSLAALEASVESLAEVDGIVATPLPQSPIAHHEESTGRFAVDPFVYEVDGPIPVMPALPIVEPQTTTDQVVAREQSGDHFAWRLMPIPYPTEGNAPQVAAAADSSEPAGSWAETEVVAENETSDNGDCFYAQAGDVISIDGNMGFDHIDLRSYSIDDATFQPGAILLHADLESTEAEKSEEFRTPITIRHRGIEFAIFHGEVRVEL